MYCKHCSKIIEKTKYNSELYCSKRCQKNYLKSEYKKRNKEKLNAYNRKYRLKNQNEIKISNKNNCYYCNARKKIRLHHISYQPEITIPLCHSCHNKHHAIMKGKTNYVRK